MHMTNLCIKKLEDKKFFKPSRKETHYVRKLKKYFLQNGAI